MKADMMIISDSPAIIVPAMAGASRRSFTLDAVDVGGCCRFELDIEQRLTFNQDVVIEVRRLYLGEHIADLQVNLMKQFPSNASPTVPL